MIVIADTSSLCYLILIDCVNVLPRLYGSVIIPTAVYQELQADEAPVAVRNWIQNDPSWLTTAIVYDILDSELDKLHRGERDAIILSERMGADLLILDDKRARKIATDRGLQIIGLLGILRDAAEMNLINLPGKLEELQKTSFFVSPKLLQSLLERFMQ